MTSKKIMEKMAKIAKLVGKGAQVALPYLYSALPGRMIIEQSVDWAFKYIQERGSSNRVSESDLEKIQGDARVSGIFDEILQVLGVQGRKLDDIKKLLGDLCQDGVDGGDIVNAVRKEIEDNKKDIMNRFGITEGQIRGMESKLKLHNKR